MSNQPKEITQVSEIFHDASSNKSADTKSKKPSPFSLRLTDEEREILNQKAGNQPLGSYIRKCLLGDNTQKRRSIRKPKIDEQKIALVLAELGRSRLSSNLNQLAKAANCGTLDVSKTTEQQLLEAYKAIITMRDNLISALGLKSGG